MTVEVKLICIAEFKNGCWWENYRLTQWLRLCCDVNCFVLTHEGKPYTPNHSLFYDLIYYVLVLKEKSCWNGTYQLPPGSMNFLYLCLKNQTTTAKTALTRKQRGILSHESKRWDKVHFQWLVTLLSISKKKAPSSPAERFGLLVLFRAEAKDTCGVWNQTENTSYGICLT